MTEQTILILTLAAYYAALFLIGLWATRRTRDAGDFYLAGRRLGPIVAGLSYAATTSSAWVLLGFVGFVYTVGLAALWMVPGILAGYALAWLFVGARLQTRTAEAGFLTLTDYLADGASGEGGRLIKGVSGLLILFCFVFYIASQFQGAGQAFNIQFDMSYTLAVLLAAAIILFYTLLGGFWAVSVTDVLQGLIMASVAILLPLAAVDAAGGPAALIATLRADLPESYFDWAGGRSGLPLLFFAIGTMSIGLGTLGQPHLLNRLMALKDGNSRRQGFFITLTWGVIVYAGMATLALAGRALGPYDNPEMLMFRLGTDLLPAIFSGLVLAAVLSAIMSTVDSQLLVAASAVTHDLGVKRLWPRRELLLSRLVMAGVCAAAIALTFCLPDTIFRRVLFAWTALGAAFGPTIVLRVLGLAPAPLTILAAILGGFGAAVAFYLGPDTEGDFAERLLPWAIGFLILLTGPKAKAR